MVFVFVIVNFCGEFNGIGELVENVEFDYIVILKVLIVCLV